jgi:hypothetical protein
MDQCKSRIKDLSIGDLVTHVIYGNSWIGIILGFMQDGDSMDSRGEKALVKIQPGTKHEGFFKNRVASQYRMTDNIGFVTTNWLFKMRLKNDNSRSTRDET